MSSAFSKPKKPKLPPVQPIEDVQVVEDTAEDAARKRKKNVGKGGRQSTVLSGIQAALKKRLGE